MNAAPAGFRKAFLVNLASASAANAVGWVVAIMLARLLTPAEMGVYALALAFVNVVHVFRDLGVMAWLQREPDLSTEKIRSALGLLYVTTGLAALVLLAAAGPLSRWFGHEELRAVVRVLALGLVLMPSSSITSAWMLRSFAAMPIAYVSLAGTLVYGATALVLAWLGLGAMSLALAQLANVVACALAQLPLRPAELPWRPSFGRWRPIVRFGLGSVLTDAMSAVDRALPSALLGKLGSAHQVGLIARAQSTVGIFAMLTGTAIGFGSLSYLAHAHQRIQSLGPVLGRAAALLTGVGWPALACTCLLGREIVLTLFGNAWLGCVDAIPALAAVAALGMLFNFSGPALAAIGRPHLAALPFAVMTLSNVALAWVFFDGSVAGFALILLFGSLLALPVRIFLQSRYLGLPLGAMIGSVKGSLIVTLASAVAVAVLMQGLPRGTPAPITLLVASPLALAAWYAAIRLTGHECCTEVDLLVQRARACSHYGKGSR